MNDAEIEALEAQYRKAVYPSHVPGAYNIVFDSNLIEKGVRKLLDEVKLLNLQNSEMRDLLISVNQAYTMTFGGERGSMEAMFKTIDKYLKEQQTEKRICEHGDWIPVAGHALRCGKCNAYERTNLA